MSYFKIFDKLGLESEITPVVGETPPNPVQPTEEPIKVTEVDPAQAASGYVAPVQSDIVPTPTTGVSEPEELPTTGIEPASDPTPADPVQLDIDTIAQENEQLLVAADEGCEIAQQMENLIAPVQDGLARDEQLNETGTRVLAAAVESLMRNYPIKNPIRPAVESFVGGKSSVASTLALEGAITNIKAVIRAVVGMVVKAYDGMREFYSKFFGRVKNLRQQIEHVKQLAHQAKEGEITDQKLISKLVVHNSCAPGHINNAIRYSNNLMDQFSAVFRQFSTLDVGALTQKAMTGVVDTDGIHKELERAMGIVSKTIDQVMKSGGAEEYNIDSDLTTQESQIGQPMLGNRTLGIQIKEDKVTVKLIELKGGHPPQSMKKLTAEEISVITTSALHLINSYEVFQKNGQAALDRVNSLRKLQDHVKDAKIESESVTDLVNLIKCIVGIVSRSTTQICKEMNDSMEAVLTACRHSIV